MGSAWPMPLGKLVRRQTVLPSSCFMSSFPGVLTNNGCENRNIVEHVDREGER